VAGISVSGPTSRVGPERLAEFSAAVLAAARALTDATGGQRPNG
jgi:IclR family acetate operon transcriptional repressor